MNDLKIINYNGINVTDSREVAQMIGKRHDHLIRDIQGYIKILDLNPNLGTANFFILSAYKDTNNQERPCYLLTKQGCEMVANKMTGQKGVLFTAEYVQAFNKMKNVLKYSYMIDDPIERAKVWIKEQEEKRKEIEGLKKDSIYLQQILNNPSLVTITQIAKDYGMSGKKLNDTLHQLKIQYKQNGQWLLYSSYQDKGYTHSKTIAFKHSDDRPDTKMITEWTQAGRKFLYEMLKSINILPLIEKYGEQVSIPNSKNIQA